QQIDPREPVGVAIEQSAADPHRRDPRHVGAVGEGRPHHVELPLDAEGAVEHRRDVELRLNLHSAEGRIALLVDGLVQMMRMAVAMIVAMIVAMGMAAMVVVMAIAAVVAVIMAAVAMLMIIVVT